MKEVSIGLNCNDLSFMVAYGRESLFHNLSFVVLYLFCLHVFIIHFIVVSIHKSKTHLL